MASYDQLVNSGGTIFNQGAKVAYSGADQLAADLGTTADKIQWGSIAKAGADFNPAGYMGYNAPNQSITVDQMKPVASLNVPTLDTTKTNANTNGLIAGTETANKSLDSFVKEQYTAPTEAEKTQKSVLDSLASLTGQNTGQEQYRIEQQDKLGAPQIKAQISDLNSQVLSGLAELTKMEADFNKANLEIAQRPQQLSGVVGTSQQENMRTYAITRASKASEIGLIQARQAALGGQLETAYSLADRAVTAKYAPIEDQIKVKMAQLDAIAPSLNKDEKIREEALRRQYTQEQESISEQKTKSKENINLALTLGLKTQLGNKNGEWFDTRTGYTFTAPEDLFSKTGLKSFAEAYQKGLVSDVDNSTILEKDQVGQLMSQYWDSGVTMNDTLESAKQKIQKNSKIWAKQNSSGSQSTASERLLVKQQSVLDKARKLARGENTFGNPNEYLDFASEYIGASGNVNDFLAAVPPARYLSESDSKWVKEQLTGKSATNSSGLDPAVAAFLGM